MGKRAPMLDWQMLEEDAAWPPSAFSPTATAKARQLSRRWWRWALVVLVAVLLPALIEGYQEVRSADQAMDRVENDVRAAVTAADSVHQQNVQTANPGTSLRTGPSLQSNREPGVEARSVEVAGAYAMVEVWTTASDEPWLPAPYRQTRFYQETEQGWLPTDPPDAFYQPLDTLQVGRFTFVYSARDASAVLQAARQVEELDANLRTELGLSPTVEALTIMLSPSSYSSGDPVYLANLSRDATLYIPSPALLRLPAHISEGDALLQLVAGLLTKRDLDEALTGSPQVCNWRSLALGLRLWLLWEHSELPSQTRHEVASFLEYKMAQGSIPYLTWLSPDHNSCSLDPTVRNLAGSYTNSGAAPAFVEYAISTYGHDRLPALIEGMKRYDTWEALIPATYGVSVADFETGWQDYLHKDEGGRMKRAHG